MRDYDFTAMMAVAHVLEIADLLGATIVRFWIDGGWGIDVFLCRQTREQDASAL